MGFLVYMAQRTGIPFTMVLDFLSAPDLRSFGSKSFVWMTLKLSAMERDEDFDR